MLQRMFCHAYIVGLVAHAVSPRAQVARRLGCHHVEATYLSLLGTTPRKTIANIVDFVKTSRKLYHPCVIAIRALRSQVRNTHNHRATCSLL